VGGRQPGGSWRPSPLPSVRGCLFSRLWNAAEGPCRHGPPKAPGPGLAWRRDAEQEPSLSRVPARRGGGCGAGGPALLPASTGQSHPPAARGPRGDDGISQLVFSSGSLLGGCRTRAKSRDSAEGRTGVCRAANRLLSFAAQLHPAGASEAQSQAAGKLEERSEGEGPHQLSQQRKDHLRSPAGRRVSSVGGERCLGGRNPPKPGSGGLAGCSDPRFASSPWGCCRAWMEHVLSLGPSCCARASGFEDQATLCPGALGLMAQRRPIWALELPLGSSWDADGAKAARSALESLFAPRTCVSRSRAGAGFKPFALKPWDRQRPRGRRACASSCHKTQPWPELAGRWTPPSCWAVDLSSETKPCSWRFWAGLSRRGRGRRAG